jgi:hypothetical protein
MPFQHQLRLLVVIELLTYEFSILVLLLVAYVLLLLHNFDVFSNHRIETS